MARSSLHLQSFLVAAGLATLAWAGSASAVTCYIIFDRADAVIYRDANPPFDLTDTNSRDRTALRSRGMHLMIAEFEQCFSVGYVSTAPGGASASVDDIVNQLRPAIDPSLGQAGRPLSSAGTGMAGGSYVSQGSGSGTRR